MTRLGERGHDVDGDDVLLGLAGCVHHSGRHEVPPRAAVRRDLQTRPALA